MQRNLDEFLSARVGAEKEDDDDAGPEIAVGSRAVSMRSEVAASIAAASVGAASLHVQFCTTQCTLFDEFLSARVGAEEDNDDDPGPEIAVGSRAVSMQSGGAASTVASSIGAASLHVRFRTMGRTLEELNQGEIIARKQDHGLQGSKTYIAICKAATTPLPNNFLGP